MYLTDTIGYGSTTRAGLIAVTLTCFGGCGCELYRSKATASGAAYALDAPEEKFEIRMEWDDVFDDSLADATPVEGRVALVCLSVEPDSIRDLVLILNYGLELGATQTATVVGPPVGCHVTGERADPLQRTRVRGDIDWGNTRVEFDTIEATSTSLQPPEYDLILGGADESGRRYQFELHLKIERTGNQPSCT